MMIIQSKMKKTISMLIVIIMLLSITMPVFAGTNLDSINKNDTLKFTGNSWTVYKDSNCTQVKRYLKTNDTITVSQKNGNKLKIGTNEYIKYGSSASSFFTKVNQTSTTQKPSTGGSSGSGGTATGIGDAIGGLVSGIGTVVGGIAESGVLQELLQKVIEIVGQLFQKVVSGLGNISLPSFDIPSIELPTDEKTLELSPNSKTLTLGENFTLKATVNDEKVTATFSSSDTSKATVGKSDGKVQAKGEGKATITAKYTCEDGKVLKATCEVKVTAKTAAVDNSNLSINRTTVKPEAGDWTTFCNNLAANNNEWLGYIEQSSKKHGVRADTVMAIMYAESRGSKSMVNNINSSGYCGLMQVLYESESDLVPKNNIDKGCAELAEKIKAFNGDERKGIQAYFSGVAGTKRKINNGETFSYYNKIKGYRDTINQLYTFK